MDVNEQFDNIQEEITIGEDPDPVDAYRQSLSELVFNSKPHIVFLTMLADESKDTRAADIVQCIEDRLYQVNKDMKLPTLYLIDSIIKNISKSPYVPLFQKKIIKLFCHTFEKADEKTRLLLYKLRQTWNDYFQAEVLINLDMAVKKIDSGWPIVSANKMAAASSSQNGQLVKQSNSNSNSIPKPVIHKISTMPPASKQIKSFNSIASTSSSSSSSFNEEKTRTGTAHPTIVILKAKEIVTRRDQIEQELRKELINNCKTQKIVNNSSNKHSNIISIGGGGGGNNKSNNNSNNNHNKIEQQKLNKRKSTNDIGGGSKKISNSTFKKKKKSHSNDTHDLLSTISSSMEITTKKTKAKIPNPTHPNNSNSNNNKRKQPVSPTIHPSTNHLLNKLTKKTIAHQHSDDLHAPVAPADVIPLGRDHHVSVTKRVREIRIPKRENNVSSNLLNKNNIKQPQQNHRSPNARNPSPPSSSSSTSSSVARNSRTSPTKSSVMMIKDNSHQQLPPSTQVTTIPAPNVFSQPEVLFQQYNNNTGQHQPAGASFAMDRDYRRELETVVNDAQQKLIAGTITSADHELLVKDAERQFYELQNQQQQQQSNMPPPLPPSAQPMQPMVPVVMPNVQPPQQQQPPLPFLQQPNAPPQFNAPMVAPPQMAPPQPPPSSSLDPPYGSSAIYINKQFVRLFYLDHITSIVSFQAHPETPFDRLASTDPGFLEPKQVYFSGHPTKITMDPGSPSEQSFCLKFNEPQPFLFSLPGCPTPQRIMLGLPDRELIINDCPIKAQFGGPPITVYMDGDHQNHLFVLSDSRPFLKVSEEPRYDLWHRLVNEAKAKAASFGFGNTVNNAVAVPPPSTIVPTMPNNMPGGGVMVPTSTINTFTIPANVCGGGEQKPFINSTFSSSLDSKPPMADLKSLLSKLTEVGLINQQPPAAATTKPPSMVVTDQSLRKKSVPNQPKQYLPMDPAILKQYHQFVIDQLYTGIQCTNCSLRFPEEHCRDDETAGEKSRYSRHLDWHFRQNRRDKTKPEFGSATVAHRRSWYYNFDQWILYKEVNDDIDEDNTTFFDSNSAQSPGANNKASMYNANFSEFKNSITEYDLFIEAISCDKITNNNNNDDKNDSKEKMCTVVAESDVTSNCTVCNEPFEPKWFEDEEEWRLMNAVSYTTTTNNDAVVEGGGGGDGGKMISKNFHPLCLKDYLLQQLEKEQQQSQNSSSELDETNNSFNTTMTVAINPISRVEMIPGLDTPMKEEEEDDLNNDNSDKQQQNEMNIEMKNEMNDHDDNNRNPLEHQLEQTGHEEGEEQNRNEMEDQQNEKEEEMEVENFEVKVEEFEILIANTGTGAGAPTESSDSIKNHSDSDPNNSDSGQNENDKKQQQQQQPKRGGIVIKMKGSKLENNTTNTNDHVEATTISSNMDNDSNNQHEPENGNVLAVSNDDDDNNDEMTTSTNINDDDDGGQQNIKDENDDDDDDKTKQTNDDDDDDDSNNNKGMMNIVDDVHDDDDNRNDTISGSNNNIVDDNDDVVDDHAIVDPQTTVQVDTDTIDDDQDHVDHHDDDVHNDDENHIDDHDDNCEQPSSPTKSESNDNDEPLAEINDADVPEPAMITDQPDDAAKSMNADDDEDQPLKEGDADSSNEDAADQDADQDADDDHQSNYYSRGKEMSALCTIM